MSKPDPLAGLKGMQAISFESIQTRKNNDRLRPTLKEMAKDLGRPIKHKADGTPYIPVDNNEKRQKDALVGAVGPWAKAEVGRIAEEQGYPGDYGGGLRGAVMLPPLAIAGEWCKQCDKLLTWCDCPRSGTEANNGKDASRGT